MEVLSNSSMNKVD